MATDMRLHAGFAAAAVAEQEAAAVSSEQSLGSGGGSDNSGSVLLLMQLLLKCSASRPSSPLPVPARAHKYTHPRCLNIYKCLGPGRSLSGVSQRIKLNQHFVGKAANILLRLADSEAWQ